MSAKGQLRAAVEAAPVHASTKSGGAPPNVCGSASGDDVFNSWFGSVQLEEFVAGKARLSVSTRFLKSWIEGHYQEKLLAALSSELRWRVRSRDLRSFDAHTRRVRRRSRAEPVAEPLAAGGDANSDEARLKPAVGARRRLARRSTDA